jgi:hypothetical protein
MKFLWFSRERCHESCWIFSRFRPYLLIRSLSSFHTQFPGSIDLHWMICCCYFGDYGKSVGVEMKTLWFSRERCRDRWIFSRSYSSMTFDPQPQSFSHKVPWVHMHLFDDMTSVFWRLRLVGRCRNETFMVFTRKVPRSLHFVTFLSISFDLHPHFFSHKDPCVHIHLLDDNRLLFWGLRLVGKCRDESFMVFTRKVPRSLDILTFSSIPFDPQPQFFSYKVPWVHIHSLDDNLSLFRGLGLVGKFRNEIFMVVTRY